MQWSIIMRAARAIRLNRIIEMDRDVLAEASITIPNKFPFIVFPLANFIGPLPSRLYADAL